MSPTRYQALPDDEDARGYETDDEADRLSPAVYAVFALLGVSMLWAWNMFLAAAPYFQHILAPNPSLLSAYPPTLLSVSTLTNLVSMLYLTRRHATANYPRRIMLALVLNFAAFALLAASTGLARRLSPTLYFFFLMTMVLVASLSAGLCQNGVFAYVSGWSHAARYTQAIMTGQAVAGVLPCLAQIISVVSFGTKDDPAESALLYFCAAVLVSLATLFSFSYLLRYQVTPKHAPRTAIPWISLYRQTYWMANAVFLTFTLTMFYPVFTQQISSTTSTPSATFIPLAFLVWNLGDLSGRLSTLVPFVASLVSRPRFVFLLSVIRALWIPLYLLCNRQGHPVAFGDIIYLGIVQFGFGLGNGLLGSLCMMGASLGLDDPSSREAAGSFMGLMLVGGLTAGSLASFLVS